MWVRPIGREPAENAALFGKTREEHAANDGVKASG